jgi:hypothetical protein
MVRTIRLRATIATVLWLAISACEQAPKALSAQEAAHLSAEVELMVRNGFSGDYRMALLRTHPKLVQAAGGIKKFEELIRDSMKPIEGRLQLVSISVGAPTVVYPAGNEELCFVPKTLDVMMEGQTVRRTGFMVASRKVGFREWTFVDGSGLQKNPDMLKTLFPDLDEDTPVPEIRMQRL